MLEEWTKAKLLADRDNRDTKPIPKFDLFSFLKKESLFMHETGTSMLHKKSSVTVVNCVLVL